MKEDASQLLKTVTTHLVTLLVGFMVYKGTVSSNEAELIKTMMYRIEVLESQNRNLQEKLILLGAENASLKLEMTSNLTRKKIYQEFLDFLPFPAWIKVKHPDGKFRMVMINNAYVYKYGISKGKYEGSTDAEIWGQDIANHFEQADHEIYESKNYVVTHEMIPKDGVGSEEVETPVLKFSVKLGEVSVGVAGVVVSPNIK